MSRLQNSIAGLSGLFVIPLVLQFAAWYVEGEAYSLSRALTIIVLVTVLIVGPVGLAYGRGRGQELMLVALALVGLATAVVGGWTIFTTRTDASALLNDVLGVIAVSGGLFVIGVAGYLFRSGRSHIRLGRGRAAGSVDLQRWSGTRGGPVIHRAQRQIRPDRDLEPVLSRALHLDGLHYVSLFTRDRFQFSTDILERPELDLYFGPESTRDQRRRRYREKGGSLGEVVRQLNPHLNDIESGKLIRLVLDVELGALYYYWVNDYNFLVGVTLKQIFVNEADAKMEKLVDEIRRIDLGERPVAELEQR